MLVHHVCVVFVIPACFIHVAYGAHEYARQCLVHRFHMRRHAVLVDGHVDAFGAFEHHLHTCGRARMDYALRCCHQLLLSCRLCARHWMLPRLSAHLHRR